MAIETALIAKIGGGLVVAGSAGGVGIAYRKQIFEAFQNIFSSKKSVKHEYLVVAYEANSNQTAPSENLYGTKNTDKKFKCQKDEKNIDETCEIYSLSEDTTTHFLNIKTLASDTKPTAKLENNKYYKLKVDSSKFTSITYDEKYLIDIKSTEGTNLSYGKLKVLGKIENDSLVTDYKLVIAKVNTTNITDTSTTNYQCEIGEKNKQKLDCDIYKFNPALTSLSSITFATSPTKITTALSTDLTKDNYYIIDFSDAKNNDKLSHLTKENLNHAIVFAGTGDTTKKAEFTEVKTLVGKYKEGTATNNKVFMNYLPA